MPTTNIISYNQLMQMYKDFADAHYFLNDFGNGPTSEIGTSRQMKFPYMWITHRTPSDINVQNKTAIPEFTLSFIIVDQINNQANYLVENGTESDNQQEVLSDTFQVLQDLITYHQTTMGQFGVQIVDELVTVEALYDETDDKVTGWIADIKIRLKHSNCVTPLGSIILTVPGTSNISLQFLNCETLATCPIIQEIQNDIIDINEDITDIYRRLDGLTEDANIVFLSSGFYTTLSGENITQIASTNNTLTNITYSPTLDMYVAFGINSGLYYSYDLITWTLVDTVTPLIGVSTGRASINWIPETGQFITTPKVWVSTDGINWVNKDTPNTAIAGVTYSNTLGMYIFRFTEYGRYYTTTDLNTYTYRELPNYNGADITRNITDLIWVPIINKFLSSQIVSTGRYESNNGINWSASTVPNNSKLLYGNNKILAIQNLTNIIGDSYVSTDGISWIPGDKFQRSITHPLKYSNILNKYISAGTTINFSSDGLNWTAIPNKINGGITDFTSK